MGLKEDEEAVKQIVQNACMGPPTTVFGFRLDRDGQYDTPTGKQLSLGSTIRSLLPVLTSETDRKVFNRPETCVHLEKTYKKPKIPKWIPLSKQMDAYVKAYEQRPMALKRLVPGKQFGHEYQAKKAAASHHSFYGVIIAKLHESTTVKQMHQAAVSIVTNLLDGWGYVCTIHNPDVSCTLQIQLRDSCEEPDPDQNTGSITWQHGDKCRECRAKEYIDAPTMKTMNMGEMQDECVTERLSEEMCPGVHLHLVTWSRTQKPILNQTAAYKAARMRFNVHMTGQRVIAGAQTLMYVLSPPRLLMPASPENNTFDTHGRDQMFMAQDTDGVLKRIVDHHSSAAAMEMILNKHIQRTELRPDVTGLYPTTRTKHKQEQMFDMFLYVIKKYNIDQLSEIPNLKREMERQNDLHVGPFHSMTLNPRMYSSIWLNAVSHLKQEIQQTSLQQHISQYIEQYGTDERLDETENKTVMSLTESETAFKDVLHRQGISDTAKWVNDMHNLFDKKTPNPKQNAMCIYGESNAGKSWIFRPIQRACPNHTVIGGQMKQQNQFMFMNTPGKRWILFNEITINDTSQEKFKELLGGERMEVEIKFLKPETIFRTPCIMTCNRHPYDDVTNQENKTALKERMKLYRWNRINWTSVKWNGAGDLHPGVYIKKPSPLAPQPKKPNIVTAADKTRAASDRLANAIHEQLRRRKTDAMAETYARQITEKCIVGYMAIHHTFTPSEQQAREHMVHLTDSSETEHDTSECSDPICRSVSERERPQPEKRKSAPETETPEQSNKVHRSEQARTSDADTEQVQMPHLTMEEYLDLKFTDTDLAKQRMQKSPDRQIYSPITIPDEESYQSQHPSDDEWAECAERYEREIQSQTQTTLTSFFSRKETAGTSRTVAIEPSRSESPGNKHSSIPAANRIKQKYGM